MDDNSDTDFCCQKNISFWKNLLCIRYVCKILVIIFPLLSEGKTDWELSDKLWASDVPNDFEMCRKEKKKKIRTASIVVSMAEKGSQQELRLEETCWKFSNILKQLSFMFSAKTRRRNREQFVAPWATEYHAWGWWHWLTRFVAGSHSLDSSKKGSDKVSISEHGKCLYNHWRSQMLTVLFSKLILTILYRERREG